ncbi:MAG: hypothetical protein AB8E15_06465 [Bdellovibrionales bacterium]
MKLVVLAVFVLGIVACGPQSEKVEITKNKVNSKTGNTEFKAPEFKDLESLKKLIKIECPEGQCIDGTGVLISIVNNGAKAEFKSICNGVFVAEGLFATAAHCVVEEQSQFEAQVFADQITKPSTCSSDTTVAFLSEGELHFSDCIEIKDIKYNKKSDSSIGTFDTALIQVEQSEKLKVVPRDSEIIDKSKTVQAYTFNLKGEIEAANNFRGELNKYNNSSEIVFIGRSQVCSVPNNDFLGMNLLDKRPSSLLKACEFQSGMSGAPLLQDGKLRALVSQIIQPVEAEAGAASQVLPLDYAEAAFDKLVIVNHSICLGLDESDNDVAASQLCPSQDGDLFDFEEAVKLQTALGMEKRAGSYQDLIRTSFEGDFSDIDVLRIDKDKGALFVRLAGPSCIPENLLSSVEDVVEIEWPVYSEIAAVDAQSNIVVSKLNSEFVSSKIILEMIQDEDSEESEAFGRISVEFKGGDNPLPIITEELDVCL